ncbi:hypothetical protein [Paenibacillus sp. MMS18-CY102]|uniref:hypothetical protein n=1 Tax=Paenibacillus sp. MMS18-CY102 TaxID=2682849 RepID=UPI0013660026|nr:hypothetical protein [Paenibacillus sp. MMS18-CY102]MWC30941.1 hypothetical protein [Paenibacillus sp. MMS18-CY102]
MSNTIKIFLVHCALCVIAIFIYFVLDRYSDLYFIGFVLVAVPLVYIGLGYKYVNEEDSTARRAMSYLVISLIGIIVWALCFVDSFNDASYDITDTEKSDYSFLPPEMIWVLYGVYQSFLFAAYIIFNRLELLDVLNKYSISISSITFVINLSPIFFIWLGFTIKKLMKKIRR